MSRILFLFSRWMLQLGCVCDERFPLFAAREDKRPRFVVGWSVADKCFRPGPEPLAGVILDSNRNRKSRRRNSRSRSSKSRNSRSSAKRAGWSDVVIGVVGVSLAEDDGIHLSFGFLGLIKVW